MSKFKFYFISLIATITIISCSKDDNKVPVEPPRDYAVQYATDIADIETYLKTNYFTVVNHPGFADDQDVTITKIPDGGTQPSIWSYLNSNTFPKLLSRDVSNHDIIYKLYYLVIREGIKDVTTGVGGENPCNVDGVFAGYKGTLLDGTVFDSSNNGQVLFNLDGTPHDGGEAVFVRGWSEGFPKFKTGQLISNDNGTISYANFGSGAIFIPSGLAYYNAGTLDIPAYSPLVFSIKLYALKRYDHDADGIPSYLEDLNGDGYMNRLATGVKNPDDTDGDEIPDFLDFDDDGDNYATRGEIKDASGKYYEFDKIPDCSGNQTDPLRKKRHLDKDCIKMNQ